MKRKSKCYWASWCHSHPLRSGFTLIEVVVGLALLGSLLVGISLARARNTRQQTVAERRLRAIAATELLLTQWWQALAAFPRNDTGSVPGDPDFWWRTSLTHSPDTDGTGAVIVHFEMYDREHKESALPLVVVDVAIPEAQREEFPVAPEDENSEQSEVDDQT